MSNRNACTLLILMASFLTTPAFAVDGAIEIAQAGAGSFPIVISKSGRHVLTSNLQVTNFGTSAIRIDVDDVTLDLNGFEVEFVFSGGPVADGIAASGRKDVRILGGTIRGFAGNCLRSGDGASVEDLKVQGCGLAGLSLASRARVIDVEAVENGGDGIRVGIGSVVERAVAESNGGTGIAGGANNVIVDSSTRENGGAGIRAGGSIRGNTILLNEGDGIDVFGASVLRANSVSGNGGWGIENLGNFCTLSSSRVGYAENVIVGNTSGTIGNDFSGLGTGCLIETGSNVCGTNTTCP